MTARTVSADDLETMARAAHAPIELPGPEGGWAVAVINGRPRRAWVAAVSIERLRRAAALMRAQHGPDHPRHEMWWVMSAWLEHVANAREALDGIARHQDETPGQGSECFLTQERHALAVAHAYLGGAQ